MAKLGADERNELPAKDFAEPGKRAYPVEDKPHARNAKARARQAVKAGRMSKAEAARIDAKADRVIRGGVGQVPSPSRGEGQGWGCSR